MYICLSIHTWVTCDGLTTSRPGLRLEYIVVTVHMHAHADILARGEAERKEMVGIRQY